MLPYSLHAIEAGDNCRPLGFFVKSFYSRGNVSGLRRKKSHYGGAWKTIQLGKFSLQKFALLVGVLNRIVLGDLWIIAGKWKISVKTFSRTQFWQITPLYYSWYGRPKRTGDNQIWLAETKLDRGLDFPIYIGKGRILSWKIAN